MPTMEHTSETAMIAAMQTIQIAPSVRPSPCFLDLPESIYPVIASFLDRSDLYALLKVSKAWQVPTESILWSYLNLIAPLKVSEVDYGRSMEDVDAALTMSTPSTRCSDSVCGAGPTFGQILSKLAPYIERLEIGVDFASGEWIYESPEFLYEAMTRINAPNVTNLEINFGYTSTYLLEAMLHSLPGHESLTISTCNMFCSRYLPEPPSVFHFPTPLALNRLETITIFCTYHEMVGGLTRIAQAAPNLREMEFMGDDFGDDPVSDYRQLMKALGRCKNLKVLSPAVFHPYLKAYDAEMDAPAFGGLEGIRVYEKDLARNNHRGCLMVIHDIYIPPILSITYMQPWHQYVSNSWEVPLTKPLTHYRRLDNAVVNRLRKARRLDNIMIVINYTQEPHLSPCGRCSNHRDGITIKSYTDGSVELLDVRQLTRYYREFRPQRYEKGTWDKVVEVCRGDGHDHDLLKWSWYEGECVDQKTMDEAYRLSDVKDDWKTCGRDMKLSEASWQFLRVWKEATWTALSEGVVSFDF